MVSGFPRWLARRAWGRCMVHWGILASGLRRWATSSGVLPALISARDRRAGLSQWIIGIGQPVALAADTRAQGGWVRGAPRSFSTRVPIGLSAHESRSKSRKFDATFLRRLCQGAGVSCLPRCAYRLMGSHICWRSPNRLNHGLDETPGLSLSHLLVGDRTGPSFRPVNGWVRTGTWSARPSFSWVERIVGFSHNAVCIVVKSSRSIVCRERDERVLGGTASRCPSACQAG